MRWWLLFLLCVPLVSADTGWYYAGDSFKIGDVLYSVEGSSHERVFLGAGSRSYFITLGECVKDGLSEYCYLKTAYPSDDAHIKYAAGNRYYGYQISISSIKPDVSISRDVSTKVPKLGEKIEVTITVENEGDYAAQYFSYNETIPAGIELVSGDTSYTRKSIAPGEVITFRYILKPTDYVNAQMLPNISYQYEGGMFTGKLAALSLFVDTPLVVNRTFNAKSNLGEVTEYRLNITNKGDAEMRSMVTIQLPQGFKLIKSDFVGSRNLTADIALKPGSTKILTFSATSTMDGNFKIPVELTATIHGTSFKRYYEESISVKADKLVPTISVTPGRASYAAGERVSVVGVLENVNDGVTFRTISGTLRTTDATKNFSHDSFAPKKKLTEAELDLVLPMVNESTMYNITFAGKYSTPTGGLFDFEAKKSITVYPVVQAVAVTHKVEPAAPKPGSNVTVTVTGRNTLGKYVTFTAFDTSDLDNVGGLMFIETSLERDVVQTLYIYQLEVPADFDQANFNITTSVKLKDEPNPVKTTITVPIQGRTQLTEQVETGTEQGADVETPKEELGFFASVWDFMKNLF